MKKVIFLGLLSTSLGAYAVDNPSTKLIADDPFFKDTKIELGARNYYKYLKEDEGTSKTVHAGWG
ncbi:hypothetical protein [Orbus mooreae]|uniref:hypothetical protein n=1 Tax=Orbus mooreae TaxID=3074107 RepID=UPI00370DC7E9